MKRFVLALLAAVILLAALPLTVSAETMGLRWKQRPLDIVLVPETQDARILAAMQHAADVWSLSPVVDMTVGPQPSGRKPYVRVSTYYEADSAVVARTAISNERGWISGASIRLNTWWTDGFADSALRVTLCHEAGHTLGLAHNDDNTSCMYAALTVNETPTAEDYADLLTLYGR